MKKRYLKRFWDVTGDDLYIDVNAVIHGPHCPHPVDTHPRVSNRPSTAQPASRISIHKGSPRFIHRFHSPYYYDY